MMFEEALKHLEAGDYISRSVWDATGEYLVALPGIPYYWKIITQPNQNAGTWVPTRADYLADDYKVHKKCESVVQITSADAA